MKVANFVATISVIVLATSSRISAGETCETILSCFLPGLGSGFYSLERCETLGNTEYKVGVFSEEGELMGNKVIPAPVYVSSDQLFTHWDEGHDRNLIIIRRSKYEKYHGYFKVGLLYQEGYQVGYDMFCQIK